MSLKQDFILNKEKYNNVNVKQKEAGWVVVTNRNLSHLDEQGRGKMVDVTEKEATYRQATAEAKVKMKKETLQKIKEGGMAKGDVLGVAQTAGVLGAKQTPYIVPMCHPLLISGVDFSFDFQDNTTLLIRAVVKVKGSTGVEMEALTAVSTAALTVYDMCKAVDKDMKITDICLVEKIGGKSGHYVRSEREGNE